ncbi:3-methyl-2-oxobutanoate dehydrogenase subunit VorB [Endomicrobium proavitum]|uniref:Ketoisovalerate oxidoreductase subunit VorB n=1 Tax=Endomicrobium proavitum TaxID=1408281 RepID=A0A0G3WIL0_9BACT|nr:3-methyl-2-oxobutanoate dehydrogenase subunit VorB [Endomicrobium proavitum]AKL97717.1 Ketoisovalerate oxidoreductase subunit VorB [Endomicrobium proavitum]
MSKKLIKGNIALCEGAIAAGLHAYFGYPITPQNEIPAYLSRKMVELGRVFIQGESEIASANMVMGAVVTGKRAMTSSSSPGISLKQEAISYMAGMELPALIVNVQRGGPGLGNISGSQADYFQAVKGGGHGDYKLVVFAPNSAQEMYETAYDAFDLAEKYRIPVMILSDGIVGQMMEPVEFNRPDKKEFGEKSWALTGCAQREPRSVQSLLMKDGALENHNIKLQKKYAEISKNEVRCESYETGDAEVVVVAYGISSRIAKSAVKLARKEGVKAGLLRPQTLWPFPSQAIAKLADSKAKFLTVELSHGQMVEDVRLAVNGKTQVEFFGKAGGGIVNEKEILEKIKKMKLGS